MKGLVEFQAYNCQRRKFEKGGRDLKRNCLSSIPPLVITSIITTYAKIFLVLIPGVDGKRGAREDTTLALPVGPCLAIPPCEISISPVPMTDNCLTKNLIWVDGTYTCAMRPYQFPIQTHRGDSLPLMSHLERRSAPLQATLNLPTMKFSTSFIAMMDIPRNTPCSHPTRYAANHHSQFQCGIHRFWHYSK